MFPLRSLLCKQNRVLSFIVLYYSLNIFEYQRNLNFCFKNKCFIRYFFARCSPCDDGLTMILCAWMFYFFISFIMMISKIRYVMLYCFMVQVKSYLGEIEDVVNWLTDFEQTLKAVKTIGALPDTAQKQCEKFNVSTILQINIVILLWCEWGFWIFPCLCIYAVLEIFSNTTKQVLTVFLLQSKALYLWVCFWQKSL